jgi:hypothetical protein
MSPLDGLISGINAGGFILLYVVGGLLPFALVGVIAYGIFAGGRRVRDYYRGL